MKRITVNLAPSDLKKEGPAYDLPIAVGILLATEQIAADVTKTVFIGELASYLRGDIPAPEYKSDGVDLEAPAIAAVTGLADIKGQEHVKRALEVAAAGGHNIVMCGPPGIGTLMR